MKQAIFIGVVIGVLVFIIAGGIAMMKASSDQWQRNEQNFREACAKVNGTAVWNNKYLECLK